MMVFEPSSEYVAKEPNISKNILENLTKYFKKLPSPEEILNYIYAILYSSMYRTEFSEFLKTDFPRIPFTKNYNLFTKLAELGQRLVNLHLINSQELDTPLAKCYGEGEKTIKKVQYENGQVYINNNYYFEPVLEEIWNYHIGGYQVCHKWLKDRKGRSLSLEEIEQYCKIVTSISKTILIQKEIDVLCTKIYNSLIEF
jgi:predicted helicase